MPLPVLRGDDGSRRTVMLGEQGAKSTGSGSTMNPDMLISAIKSNDNDLVVHLLANNKVVPRQFEAGRQTALEVAAMMENEEVVQMLLERNFAMENADCLRNSIRNPLRSVGRSGTSSRNMSASPLATPVRPRKTKRKSMTVRNITEGRRVNATSNPFSSNRLSKRKTNSPLHWAAYKGSLGITLALLRYDFDPTVLDREGNTCLHLAATQCSKQYHGKNLTIMEILLSDETVNPMAVNQFGNTPCDLATDKEAKALLLKAIETPNCRQNFLSVHRIVQAEEGLQKLMTSILENKQAEQDQHDGGFCIFLEDDVNNDSGNNNLDGSSDMSIMEETKVGDGDDIVSDMISSSNNNNIERTTSLYEANRFDPSFDSISQQQRQLQDQRSQAQKMLAQRTKNIGLSQAKVAKNLTSLQNAIQVAEACFVQPDLVEMGKKLLKELKMRNMLESEMLHVLGMGNLEVPRLNPFLSLIRTIAANSMLPKFVFHRASRVYLYLESRAQLTSVYRMLEQGPSTENTESPDLSETVDKVAVANLDKYVKAFIRHRIFFSKKKQMQVLEANNTDADDDQTNPIHKSTRKKRKTKAPRKTRKGKKNDKNGDGANQSTKDNEEEDEDALASNENGDLTKTTSTQQDDEDEDDILIREASTLLTRLQIEIDILWCVDYDTSVTKQGTAARISALESLIRKLDGLLQQSEAVSSPPSTPASGGPTPGSSNSSSIISGPTRQINADIVAKGQARAKQLHRELKSAKRQLSEKSKVVSKKESKKKKKK